MVGRKTRASYVLRIALQKRLQVVSLGWHFTCGLQVWLAGMV